MFSILADRTYRHLFLAQIVSLLGTGLATVALGLLAYDLADRDAGLVLGTVFAIKMASYIVVAPIAGAFTDRLPRRAVLVFLDLVRAGIALALPFVTEVWQVYVLIFLLQSASAAFTPTFQATIPDIIPEEDRYTRALSLSRLAYDLENLISPMLAALLLAVVTYHGLFIGTVLGFLASALLVLSVILPVSGPPVRRGIYARTTHGIRIYLATPRLRGLLALNLAAAAAGAMVLVNTVVLIRTGLRLENSDVAVALAFFGCGSMLAALVLPRLLDRYGNRPVMFAGAAALGLSLVVFAVTIEIIGLAWSAMLAAWFTIGVGYSAVLTPSGRLLRQSAHPEDRTAIFAAQFSLSHACWLVTYPLAGWLITTSGPSTALWSLACLAVAGVLFARILWPKTDEEVLEHDHDDLPQDHPHVQGSRSHSHKFVIDEYHQHWPTHH